MRNLRNVRHSVIDFDSEGLPITATAWDAASDSLICAFGPSPSSAVLGVKRIASDAVSQDDAKLIASWDAPCPLPELETDKVLCLHYFADTATICLILAGGDLVIVREEPLPGEDLIEIVGSVDAGITAAAWSPDEELLCLTTGAGTVIFMTRDFESIANTTLSPEDVKISAHVDVGWGKRETQFQGKRAKAMRDPTMPEHVDEGALSPNDQGEITITWRGDGQWVAINTIDTIEERKRRMIRVYSREGVLDSVSEPVDGLEGALSWRPAGNLMAGIQRFSDKVDVLFFERNGLRHGEFTLRLTAEDMASWASKISVRWNSDSTVLAVSFQDRVQLWTMGNYHYYLKQEILCAAGPGESSPVKVSWHPEKATRLAVLPDTTAAGSSLRSLEYAFAVSGGSALPPYDYGMTAVVDGKQLKLTPLRLANVPPPMTLMEVELSANAVDACINRSSNCIAVLHKDAISICRSGSEKPNTEFEVVRRVQLPQDPERPVEPRQISFQGDDNIAVLYSSSNTAADGIWWLSTIEEAATPQFQEMSSSLHSIFARSDHERTCYQDYTGAVFELDVAESQDVEGKFLSLAKLPVTCNKVEVWHDENQSITFGLSSNGTLYGKSKANDTATVSDRLQIRNCTSFLVTPAHLIYTTSQHLLKFVHLHEGELEVPADEPEKDERCRAIERGARLVAVMPTSYSLTMQMPRGNLETIYPRALVLAGVRKSISSKDYKAAFFACRNHRVDMNILHDYAPEQFMSNVLLFVKQLKKVEHIDLFLSQLREEDVAETMYKETLNAPKLGLHGENDNNVNGAGQSLDKPAASSKINRICDAFLDVLQSRKSTNLQNIVTAHVCKSPPDLESGLSLIAKLREEQPEYVEKAVEHICFLADVNRLYDHALGIYDLDVALLIAQQSQKDPREYLPYVQSLQAMEPLRRQFTIDNDLKRYSKALAHLFTLGDFEELKAYMSKHELYSQAMNLYRYQAPRLNELMASYAEYLSSRNKFKEAGIAYEYLSDYTAACEAYRGANMWRESLSSATMIPMPVDELNSLAEALAEGLLESKDHYDAATIQLDYLHDVETAVRTFCKGYYFAEAMRVVGLHRKRELLETAVDPGLVEGSANMTEMLAEMKGQIAAQVPRLRELRLKKAEDPLSFFGGDPTTADGPDIPDNISLAPTDATTSAGTFMTRYTNRSSGTLASNATRKTSKNRRREERKRARGKKGSVYEEEYLVNSIGRLIERANSVKEEVERLVEGLMRRGMRERAAAVQAAMGEVVDACRVCVPEVFQVEERKEVQEGEEGVEAEAGARPGGGQGVFWDALEAGARKREPPVVKEMERLGLLG